MRTENNYTSEVKIRNGFQVSLIILTKGMIKTRILVMTYLIHMPKNVEWTSA